PGRSVRPDRSIRSAWAGHVTPARAPAATIRSPSTTTAAFGTGDAPVPSMRVAPSSTCMIDLALSRRAARVVVDSARTWAQPALTGPPARHSGDTRIPPGFLAISTHSRSPGRVAHRKGAHKPVSREKLHPAWIVLGAVLVVTLLASGLRAVFGVFIK